MLNLTLFNYQTLNNVILLLHISIIIIITIFFIKYNINDNSLEGFAFMNSQTGQEGTNLGGDGSMNSGQNPGSGGQEGQQVAVFNTEEEKDKAIRKWMHDRLLTHRVNCANTVPYNNKMGETFTSQEHEYVCEQVIKHSEIDASARYYRNVVGFIPYRIYTGKISQQFVQAVFED